MRFSPSAANRWFVCPASTVYADIAPSRPSSLEAKEGSNAHKAGELVLLDKMDYGFLDFVLPEDSLAAVQTYIDYVRDIEQSYNTKALIENRFELTIAGVLVSGTQDCIIINESEKHADVIDYKHGKGRIVRVEGNRQLTLYALGAYAIAQSRGIDLQSFTLTIVQPRAFSGEFIKSWTVSKKDLEEYWDLIYNRICYIKEHQDEHIISSECTWCPGIFMCKQIKHYVDFFTNPKDTRYLSHEEMKHYLQLKPAVTGYFSELEKMVHNLIKQNRINPHDLDYKWVMKQTNRKWIDQKRIIKTLEQEGNSQLVKKSLDTFAAIQRVKGKTFIDENTEKPEGSLTLAQLDDKRQEIIPRNQIAELMKKSFRK